jgi:hypothetical protein
MESQKRRKVGRPKLPKGEAKGRIVPVRFTGDDIKAMDTAARLSKQTLSEWIRNTIRVSLLNSLTATNQIQGSRSNDSREIRRRLRAIGHNGALRNQNVVSEAK